MLFYVCKLFVKIVRYKWKLKWLESYFFNSSISYILSMDVSSNAYGRTERQSYFNTHCAGFRTRVKLRVVVNGPISIMCDC